jgi:hypothetical protein
LLWIKTVEWVGIRDVPLTEDRFLAGVHEDHPPLSTPGISKQFQRLAGSDLALTLQGLDPGRRPLWCSGGGGFLSRQPHRLLKIIASQPKPPR